MAGRGYGQKLRYALNDAENNRLQQVHLHIELHMHAIGKEVFLGIGSLNGEMTIGE
jgi:hypothetical protein